MTDAVFDLAVNRAATFLRGAGPRANLNEWHARTRFAARVELSTIRVILESLPDEGVWHWAGGAGGAWQAGNAPTP